MIEKSKSEWIAISKAVPILGVSKQILLSMIENGTMSYIAQGNRIYLCIELAKEELRRAAEANRDCVLRHRSASPRDRHKAAANLAGEKRTGLTPIRA